MKTIKFLNILAVSTPLLLLLFSFIKDDFLIYGIVSTIFTGFLQTILAFALFFKNLKNIYLMVYFGISIFFFIYFFAITDFNLEDVFSVPFWIIPILLAIYLSALIYTFKTELPEENHE